MDIFLAGKMNGIGATDEIRKFSRVPVVYLTAFADTAIMEKAKITEPYGYILKPYQERELHTIIEISLYRYRIDRQQKESDEKYRRIVETANEGIWGVDTEGKTTLANPRMAALIGYSVEDLNGSRIMDFIFPDDLSIYTREIERTIPENKGPAICGWYIMTDQCGGCMSPLHQSTMTKGYFSGTFSMLTDITDRVTAEEKLHQINEELEIRVRERTSSLDHQVQFLQKLIDTIPSPIYYKDRDFRYIGCNKTFESYLGLSKTAIIGKTDDDILPGDLAAMIRSKDAYLIKHQGVQVYQLKFPHHDSSIRDMIIKKATFNDNNAGTIGVLGVMADISERYGPRRLFGKAKNGTGR